MPRNPKPKQEDEAPNQIRVVVKSDDVALLRELMLAMHLTNASDAVSHLINTYAKAEIEYQKKPRATR